MSRPALDSNHKLTSTGRVKWTSRLPVNDDDA